jgi:hypothetical protein
MKETILIYLYNENFINFQRYLNDFWFVKSYVLQVKLSFMQVRL